MGGSLKRARRMAGDRHEVQFMKSIKDYRLRFSKATSKKRLNVRNQTRL